MAELILATGHGHDGPFHDETKLEQAFATLGWTASFRDWKDIEPDGTPIVVRTAWDYTQHPVQFHEWLHRVEDAGGPCINPTQTMRWNMDKRYLLELEARGHRIVETVVLDHYTSEAVVNAAASRGWARAVAKPIIGGGAEGLVTIENGDASPFNLAGNKWAPDASPVPVGPCLVQPFMPEIQSGEWSLFFFGGEYSHAIRKFPADDDIRVQEEHGGRTVAATPPESVQLDAAAIADDVDATIVRVDGLEVSDGLALMELELIEPELYFRYADAREARFAQAVAAKLEA